MLPTNICESLKRSLRINKLQFPHGGYVIYLMFTETGKGFRIIDLESWLKFSLVLEYCFLSYLACSFSQKLSVHTGFLFFIILFSILKNTA